MTCSGQHVDLGERHQLLQLVHEWSAAPLGHGYTAGIGAEVGRLDQQRRDIEAAQYGIAMAQIPADGVGLDLCREYRVKLLRALNKVLTQLGVGAGDEHVVEEARDIVGKALLGHALMQLAEPTLSAIEVPLLALQSTYVDANRRRRPIVSGIRTHFMDLVEQLVPAAMAEIVTGAGHFPMIESPEVINRRIGQFLAAI